MKPTLFIGSSTESLDVAYAIQENLEHVAEVTVWTQGIFDLSKYSLDSLSDALDGSDFGVFVFTPDDVSMIRGTKKASVRDNVIFELGLFIGRLGKERNFIVLPRGSEDELHFPTDLMGLTPALYDADRQDANLRAALGPACSKLTKAISKLGKLSPATSGPTMAETAELAHYSEGDKKAILTSSDGFPKRICKPRSNSLCPSGSGASA
jgi:predicted nucleotide-binding protein